MAKLYTAEAIEKQVHILLCKDCNETDICPICDYRELIDEILDAPTVDAVEVVRCKDCKYRNDVANCERFSGERYVQANSYCSWGERREDADK